jgi:hypothetical protein
MRSLIDAAGLFVPRDLTAGDLLVPIPFALHANPLQGTGCPKIFIQTGPNLRVRTTGNMVYSFSLPKRK